MTTTTPTTRLAPSPTGALHLGNARTFLINWVLARQAGWRVLLRIDDLDGPRIKPEAADRAIETMRWLGLDWDQGPVFQSHDLLPYRSAFSELHRKDLVYPCHCSRREIELVASAPQGKRQELRYPSTCRPTLEKVTDRRMVKFSDSNSCLGPFKDSESLYCGVAWRVKIPDQDMVFVDQLHGTQRFNVQNQVGDFIVWTRLGVPAYQLAVAVDDIREGVTQIVRGDDLLASTARQLWLYRFLKIANLPTYTHLPLVVGSDGRRLAKRHGDSRLASYRASGVSAERIIGLIASWSGLDRTPMSIVEFAQLFSLDRLPTTSVTFTVEDHQWLLADGAE